MAKVIKIKPSLQFIDEHSVRETTKLIDGVEDGSDLEFLLRTNGGSVLDGWEIAVSLQNFKGKTTIDVPGISASMGIAILAFGDRNIASDKAKFMIHAPSGRGSKLMAEVAKDLYDVLSARIDEVKFKEITGKTLKQVIIPTDGEILDIWLNAKEAKSIKLIDEIYKLDPRQRVAAEDDAIGYYKFVEYKEPANKTENDGAKAPIINNKISKMNKEEFKTQNPAAYNEIYNAGIEDGKPLGEKANQERVEAFMEFAEIDPEMVSAKIKDPIATVDASFLKEISAKAKTNAVASALNEGSEDPLNAGEPKNEPKKEAAKVDLSVIPEDVKAEKMAKMESLEYTENEIKAELAEIAMEYAPKNVK